MHVPAQLRTQVHDYVDLVEQTYEMTFPPGRTEGLKFMGHLWEPLRVLPKPLALHLGCEFMRLATDGALWLQGFQCATFGVRQAGPRPLFGRMKWQDEYCACAHAWESGQPALLAAILLWLPGMGRCLARRLMFFTRKHVSVCSHAGTGYQNQRSAQK